jgi:aryl-alcohol dehydrogenase-like predicted oxidoreductase
MGGYGWGDVQEQELLDAIHAAVDHGLNFFDTADTYGLGQSERTLAKGLGSMRKDVVIESKFGVRTGDGKTIYDNSPAYIREALTGTLQRLNTDYVDIYTIHYRDETPIEDVVDTLMRLREEGKIRYFGLSNIHEDGMQELLPYKGMFVNCQDEYSLACRKFEGDLNKVAEVMDLNPLTWGSLGQGILTGKYDRNALFGSNDRRSRDIYVNFHGEKLMKNLDIVDVMRPIAEAHGVSVAAVAVRYILDYLKESVVLVGAKRPSQILGTLEAIGWNLTTEEINALDEISR